MARFDVAGDELILHLSFFERLGGFVRGDARIPLKNVWRARAVESPWEELRGIRSPGIDWPKRIAVGTWRFSGGKESKPCVGSTGRLERGAERLAHGLELDPVEHVLEEAAHDQPLGLGAREAARHQVEELARGRPGRASRRACSGRRWP